MRTPYSRKIYSPAAPCTKKTPLQSLNVTVVRYNVQEAGLIDGMPLTSRLQDKNYTGRMSNGYMSGGTGKLTGGIRGGLVFDHYDLTAESIGNNWLVWPFRGKFDILFKLDEGILISMLTRTGESSGFGYINSMSTVRLLQSDNSTYLHKYFN
jgi:hypothetical protein